MENLVPPLLSAIFELRWRLRSGQSLSTALGGYFRSHQDKWSLELNDWWVRKRQSTTRDPAPFRSKPYQHAFAQLLERGLAGHPITEALEALEREIEARAKAEIEQHIATLPFKALIPILLFQFPAYLLLLLGPLLRELGQELTK